MSTTRRFVLAAALTVGLLLGLALAYAWPADAAPAAPAPAVQVQTLTAPAPAADAFLMALVGPGTEVPANAEELLLAADRVCEGVTAEVPVMVTADTLAAELGLTDEEARHLVNTAAVTHCAAPAV
jgi:hypothetical protein